METFDSEKQLDLFTGGSPDEFLSGLSRAFTLAAPTHLVYERKLMHRGFANETALGVFDAAGLKYEVHVVKVG